MKIRAAEVEILPDLIGPDDTVFAVLAANSEAIGELWLRDDGWLSVEDRAHAPYLVSPSRILRVWPYPDGSESVEGHP